VLHGDWTCMVLLDPHVTTLSHILHLRERLSWETVLQLCADGGVGASIASY
jgi:hypothetical protein